MSLKRERQPMPAFVAEALAKHSLQARYDERPPYQRNDYLGWINRAKKPETKLRRLQQMLSELESGDRYMNMKWSRR